MQMADYSPIPYDWTVKSNHKWTKISKRHCKGIRSTVKTSGPILLKLDALDCQLSQEMEESSSGWSQS